MHALLQVRPLMVDCEYARGKCQLVTLPVCNDITDSEGVERRFVRDV